jgi:hypothetical protein
LNLLLLSIFSKLIIDKEYEDEPPCEKYQRKSIKDNGQRDAKYVILDGHHRFKILRELGITEAKIQVEKYPTGEDEKLFVIVRIA